MSPYDGWALYVTATSVQRYLYTTSITPSEVIAGAQVAQDKDNDIASHSRILPSAIHRHTTGDTKNSQVKTNHPANSDAVHPLGPPRPALQQNNASTYIPLGTKM